uniref:Uncharacterized protein n=1 Tax=Timema cristinae TaxID=61476 RepID=A0A7R9DMC3_TIMCR|nr:unnamed protein product [Timema cristinae]
MLCKYYCVFKGIRSYKCHGPRAILPELLRPPVGGSLYNTPLEGVTLALDWTLDDGENTGRL